MAVDLGLVDDLGLVEASDPRHLPQTLRRKAPVDEAIARVHVAPLVKLDRRRVGPRMRAVGLEHDLAARCHCIRERPQQRDRVGHPVQDPKAQRNVEALTQLAHVQCVHAPVLDAGSDQPSDRVEPGAAVKRHAKASSDPVDLLLIVERDNAPGTAGLGEKAVKAVKRAHVKHATARKPIRAEHR